MRLAALGVILFLSGVAGLGYQIAWTRMLAVGLGHELPGMLAVVGAFFGGLELGAWALDGPVRRTRHPLVWYAALEAVIGLWALATLALIPAANALASDLMGLSPSWARHWAVAFGVPLAVLLPATVAMGATLPAMERAVAPWVRGRRAVGGLYAANTAGAVLGTLASAFVLIPWLGMSATVSTLACVNLLCAAAVVPAIRQAAPPETGISLPPETPPLGTATPGVRTGTGILAATLLVTGALGIGFEAVGVRVLSQVLENTVYSFAATLAL